MDGAAGDGGVGAAKGDDDFTGGVVAVGAGVEAGEAVVDEIGGRQFSPASGDEDFVCLKRGIHPGGQQRIGIPVSHGITPW